MQSLSRRLLVLDTWVLATVATYGEDWIKATNVLTRIVQNCHSIVFDYHDAVMHEYEPYISRERWLGKWYKEMVKLGKIQFRPDNDVVLTAHVTDDDRKFVKLAMSLPNNRRVIVTGDSDFTRLKKHPDFVSRGIEVWDLDECSNL